MPSAEILGGDDLRRLAKALRRYGPEGRRIEEELRGTLKREAEGLVPEVRSRIRGSRARGRSGSTGLRDEMAGAVKAKVGKRGVISARILIDASEMPSGRKTLPAYHEGVKRRWRHPVFGNTDVWVQQRAAPTFLRTVRSHRARVDAAVQRAAEQIAATINRL